MTHSADNAALSVHLRYRPAIDGLRAVAVCAVFLFHLDRRLLQGGFIGVDVFFVISGYLITAILLKDFDQGCFSLATFYQRRIARILPAMFSVGVTIIVAAAVIYLPQDLASAGANFSAAILSVANLKLMFQGDYFSLSPDAQPFLHYWSLSVEEQFYLLYPTLLFLLLRYSKRRVSIVLFVLLITSCLLSVVLTRSHHIWAFYLLPTRAWELITGCLLSVACNSRPDLRIGRWLVLGLTTFAVFLIGASFALIRESPGFPSILPLPAVAGTALLLWPTINSHSCVERWLGVPWLAAVGRASYSLYLWHWPVFCFVDYALFTASATCRIALKLSLSILFAVLSYLILECPARRFLNVRRHRVFAFSFVGLSLLVAVGAGITIRQNNYINASPRELFDGGILINKNGHSGTVMLMGDSNASMYGKTLKNICLALDKQLLVISVAAGDPLPPSGSSKSNPLWDASLAASKKYHPDALVLACEWRGKLALDHNRLGAALTALKPSVGKIIIVNQPPALPERASREAIRLGSQPPFIEEGEANRLRTRVNDWLATLASPTIAVVDVASQVSNPDGSIRFTENGKQLYQDAGHLSPYGAEHIQSQLESALRDAYPINE